MSGHCPRCGIYHEEDTYIECSECRPKGRTIYQHGFEDSQDRGWNASGKFFVEPDAYIQGYRAGEALLKNMVKNKTVKAGNKVWVLHFGSIRNVEVTCVTELQGRPAITYTGYITTDFFATKEEAVEHRFGLISSAIKAIPSRLDIEESIKYLKSMVMIAESEES